MYIKVGEVGDHSLPDFDTGTITWNPPGWGSVEVTYAGATLAMLVGIKPGGFIPFHTDNPAAEHALTESLQRYHLVLTSNPRCWNYHDGFWQQLTVGSWYSMDPFREHASINLGDSIRVHLVVDRKV